MWVVIRGLPATGTQPGMSAVLGVTLAGSGSLVMLGMGAFGPMVGRLRACGSGKSAGARMDLHGVKAAINARDADLAGSRFTDVALCQATFDRVDASGATFHDCRLAEVRLSDVTLAGTVIENSDLTGLRIADCNLTGVSVNGVADRKSVV